MTEILAELTKAEKDAKRMRQLEEQVKKLQGELMEYFQVEEVLVAARLVSKSKLEEAHQLVDHLRNAVNGPSAHD